MNARLLASVLAVSLLAACGGGQKKAKEPEEKVIPEATQQRSGELQGQQQQMMMDLNSTPSEQAGAHHDARTKPVENPKYGKGKKEK